MKEALRESARWLILADTVDPEDPIFTRQPVAKRTSKKERTSPEHDKLLYSETSRPS